MERTKEEKKTRRTDGKLKETRAAEKEKESENEDPKRPRRTTKDAIERRGRGLYNKKKFKSFFFFFLKTREGKKHSSSTVKPL